MSGRLRLLVAGGCHVSGFLVGAERSFPALLANRLEEQGIPVELQTVTHLALHKPARLLQACDAFRPDWLVLQVGHFELTRKLTDLLPRFGRTAQSRSGSPDLQPVDPLSRFYKVRTGAKVLIDQALGHPLVRIDRFARSLAGFVSAAAHSGVPNALLLGPLPCVDAVSLGYRIRAQAAYAQAARQHRMPYIEMLDDLPAASVCGPDHFFADASHLGAIGHAWVAARACAAIRRSAVIPAAHALI